MRKKIGKGAAIAAVVFVYWFLDTLLPEIGKHISSTAQLHDPFRPIYTLHSHVVPLLSTWPCLDSYSLLLLLRSERVTFAGLFFIITSGRMVDQEDQEQEDIAAEEAVCRICMVALSEEAVFKLECCCKGELALAHRACAIKWFSIKGNGSCDVCSQEVLNLPVTLRRLPDRQSVIQAAAAAQAQGTQADGGGGDPTATTNTTRYRVWHGTPILIIVSMLAYFCFLEQLLVSCLLHSSLLVLPPSPSWNGTAADQNE